MKKVKVLLVDVARGSARRVLGVPVKIGVLEGVYAATPRWAFPNQILKDVWDVTHIPSGLAHLSASDCPEDAAEKLSEFIQRIGKATYQHKIRRAMKVRKRLEKKRPELFA